MSAQKNRKFKPVIFLLFGFIVGAIFIMGSSVAYGQVSDAVTNGFGYAAGTGFGTRDLRTIIFTIVNVILGFLAIVAVLIIAYGGLVWMTSRGNEQQVEKAKKILINAVIGLVVVFLSYSIAFFVFNVLMRSTGVGTGGNACNIPNSRNCPRGIAGFPDCPAHQDCADLDGGDPTTGLWNFCGPNDATVADCLPIVLSCNVTNIKPKLADGAVPRNTKVRIYFSSALTKTGVPDDFGIQRTDNAGNPLALNNISCDINDECASEQCAGPDVDGAGVGKTASCTGNYVPGTASKSGSVAEFTPNLPNDALCIAGLKCFSRDAHYRIALNDTGVFACNGAAMTCGGGDICSGRFDTGNVVDTRNPTVLVQPVQVCEGINADLQSHFKDDFGVTQVDFIGNGILLGNDNGPWGNPKDDVATFNGWVHGLLKGQIAQVRSVAIDFPGNTGQDTKNFTVHAGHCCNGILDTANGEAGIDCGGADCEACGLGPPVIDYVSPALDNGGPPNPADNDSSKPATYDNDQPHGTLDNLVTIFGRNFGTVRGTVEFQEFGTGNWKVAQLANAKYGAICTAPDWTDTSILAVVPALAAGNGPIRITEATKGQCGDGNVCTIGGPACGVGVCTAVQYVDVTNDIVAGERNIKNFLEDGKDLPGLCSVINQDVAVIPPNSGGFKDLVKLGGIKFKNAADADSKVKFGDIGTNFGPWTMNAITNVSVPNLLAGSTAWVTVQINAAPGDASNAMPFKVMPGVGAPVIYDFNPKDGNTGSYVTIVGANFGNTAGQVLFGYTPPPVDAGVLGDTTFPIVCSQSYWSNSRIIIKAPNAATGLIAVKKLLGGTADTSGLTTPNFTYGTAVKPGICLIDSDPYPGKAGTTLVHIYGEKLDNVSSVTFHKGKLNNVIGAPAAGTGNIQVVAAPADKQEVKTYVNKQAETGPVIVTDPVIGDSNPYDYPIGVCTKNDECQGGDECCTAGTSKGMCKLKGECAGLPDVSALTWYFTTGNLGPHVLKDCTRTSDCRPGGYSSPSPLYPRDGKPDGVPVDSLITANFDQLMNVGTLTLDAGGDGLLDNIVVSECTDSSCAVLVGGSQLRGALSTPKWNYNNIVNSAHAILFSPNTNLKKNTWYKVELKSGATGIKSEIGQELVGDGGVAGVSYTWTFLTKDSDAPGRAGCPDCYPKTTNFTEQYTAAGGCSWGKNCSMITGVVSDQDNVCVQLKGVGLTWAWQSLPDATRVQTFENAGDPSNDKFIQIRSLRETIINTPVKIEGTIDVAGVGAKKTTCDVYVNFGPPYISEKWPNCGSACVNAEVGVRFSRKMSAATLTKANIKIYACGSDIQCKTPADMYDINADVAIRDPFGTCGDSKFGVADGQAEEQCDDSNIINGDGCNDNCLLEGSNTKYGSICGNGGVRQKGEGCDDGNTVSGDGCSSICLVENAPEDGTAPTTLAQTEVAMQIPSTYNQGYLIPGVYYRAVFSDDITSDEGKNLGGLNWDDPNSSVVVGEPDSYSWVFKTQDDYNLCAVNSVRVNPTSGRVAVGGRINYSAAPFSSPDSCSPQYGQRLNPILYEWTWVSSDVAAATITSRDACGNGVIQLGEDCDDKNTAVGDGCSAVCVNEGSVAGGSTCGNRIKELGEDCDDGNVTPNDGCSALCLNEGVTDHSGETICGNGKKEPGEECDDGNTINGDGCSGVGGAENLVGNRMCIFEGFQQGKSVCGDGILGFGESCETCGNGATARVITDADGQTCGDSDFAFSRVATSADGCSDRCILKAPHVLVSGSNLLAPASICGNGVKEKGEDCDDGAWATGDGCSDSCRNEGSWHETNDPPNVGPFQVAEGVDDGTTVITATTLNKDGKGDLVVGTGIQGGGGLGAFHIVKHYPNGGDNCQNQKAVLVFSKEPDPATITFETVANDGSKIVIEGPGGDYIIADKNAQIEYDVNQLKISPNGGDVWEPGNYTITINNPATILSKVGANPLDCNGMCDNWEFTIVEKLCKPTRIEVTPPFASIEPGTWSYTGLEPAYTATAYDDYILQKIDILAVAGITRPNEVNDAGNNNNPKISGTLSCNASALICLRSRGNGAFEISARPSGENCASTNIKEVLGLYQSSNLQRNTLLFGCGLVLEFPATEGAPESGDLWSIPIIAGAGDPADITGLKYIWSKTELAEDQGDPAIQPVAPPPLDGQVGRPIAACVDNQCRDFQAVGSWVPFSGFRHAKVNATVDGIPNVRGSADFYVGNLCEEKYTDLKTLYDIYPLSREVDTSFILHFDSSMKAETASGLIDPLTNTGVTVTEDGFSDGTNTLGKSARWTNAGRLAYRSQGNISPTKGTISFWFYQHSLGGTQYYLSIEDSRDGGTGFTISVDDGGTMQFTYLDRSKTTGYNSYKDIPGINAWHYFVATWDTLETNPEAPLADRLYNITSEIYIDGEKGSGMLIGEEAHIFDITKQIAIGSRSFDGSDPIDANIDEFEIRYDNLTQEEIKQRFVAGMRCLGNSSAEIPEVVTCTPTGDATGATCTDINNLKCLNPQISAQFNLDMDQNSILRKNAGGFFENILVYADGAVPSPEVNMVTGVSYNSMNKTAYVTGIKPMDSLRNGLVLMMEFNPFDGTTYKDLSGNDNNSDCGPVCPNQFLNGAAGLPIHSFLFNVTRVDQYLEIPDSPSLDITGQITISAWVRPDSAGAGIYDDRQYNIICKGDGDMGYNYCLYLAPITGFITLATGDGTVFAQLPAAPGLPGEFKHIAVAYDGTNYLFYIDGVLHPLGTIPGSLTNQNNYPLYIGYDGKNTAPDHYFYGALDEVRIWKRALTQAEIDVIHIANNSQEKTVALHMTFDNKNNPVRDDGGRQTHGSCSGITCPDWTANGRYGGAMVFNGINDYVTVASDRLNPSGASFTVSAWVNSSDVTRDMQSILFRNNNLDDGMKGYYLMLGNGADRQFWFGFGDGTVKTEFGREPPSGPAKNNTWYHVVGVRDSVADMVHLYVNGKEVGSIADTTNDITDSHSFYIGAEMNLITHYFYGTIDDVQYWDRAFTFDEVKKQYYNSALLPGKTYNVDIQGGAGGVVSSMGVPMTAMKRWKLTIANDAQLCSCDRVKVTVQTGEGADLKYADKYNDLFTCAGNQCDDDTDQPPPVNAQTGNQHIYTAQCQDISWGIPVDVLSTYKWLEINDPSKIATWPTTPALTPSITVTNTSVNGDASIRVEATGNSAAGVGGSDYNTFNITNFVCNNPWPSFDSPYYIDDASIAGNATYTNFRLFYCRDKNNTPSAIDDLPALDTRIPPNF